MKIRKSLLVIIPILLFAMLAISIQAGITVNFEGWAYSESVEKMSPLLTAVMKTITHTGDPAIVYLFCLLLILLPKTRKTVALPVSISVVLAGILNILLKNIFARQRPDILRLINETDYSFPSGHAMINAALYTMLILFIFKLVKRRPLKYILSSVCIILLIAIGFSRVYLGVHYAGDVIGGWLFGFSISLLVYFIWDIHFTKKINYKNT